MYLKNCKTYSVSHETKKLIDSNSSGRTAGIVLGIIFGIILVTLTTLFILKRKRMIKSYFPPFNSSKLINQTASFSKDFDG